MSHETRLPPVPPPQLTPEQLILHNTLITASAAVAGPNDTILHWADDSGALIGPSPLLQPAPNIGTALTQVAFASSAFAASAGLSLEAKEFAILVVAAKFGAEFPWYAHSRVSLVPGVLTSEVVQAIQNHGKPEGLSDTAHLAHEIAERLVNVPGPLPTAVWERGAEVLGKDGLVALFHFVGYYVYISVCLNGVDAGVPDDSK
jgi:4-carboxymuconolactone decarboxylase